jgi:hypothetical protein
VPQPAPPAVLKRGREHLLIRRKESDGIEPVSVEKVLAAAQLAGLQLQMVRPTLSDKPPFFGGAGVLDDFISLAKKPPAAIVTFAEHWGPLGLCKHRMPWTHSLAYRSATPSQRVCSPRGSTRSRGTGGWERLELWRECSRQASDIVHEAIALKNRRYRSRDELEILFHRINRWLELAAVPLVSFAEVDRGSAWPCGLQATCAFTGVFQIIAMQLFGVVAGGRTLALCANCGIPFALSGHREGKRYFCQRCVAGKVAARYAARDYRRGLKDKEERSRRLFA